VHKLKEKAIVFDMGKLSLKDQVTVTRTTPGLVDKIRLCSQLSSEYLFVAYMSYLVHFMISRHLFHSTPCF
jgi:hypothetical protein